jgi:hypothetical protein
MRNLTTGAEALVRLLNLELFCAVAIARGARLEASQPPADFAGDWDGCWLRAGAIIPSRSAQIVARENLAFLAEPATEELLYVPRDRRFTGAGFTPDYSPTQNLAHIYARPYLGSFNRTRAELYVFAALALPGGDLLVDGPRNDKPQWLQSTQRGRPLELRVVLRSSVIGPQGVALGAGETVTLPAAFAAELLARDTATWADAPVPRAAPTTNAST